MLSLRPVSLPFFSSAYFKHGACPPVWRGYSFDEFLPGHTVKVEYHLVVIKDAKLAVREYYAQEEVELFVPFVTVFPSFKACPGRRRTPVVPVCYIKAVNPPVQL